MSHRPSVAYLVLLGLTAGSVSAAPEVVTGWTTTTPTNNPTNSFIDGLGAANTGQENIARLDFDNRYSTVSSFTTASGLFVVTNGLQASNAFVRRGAVGPNRINMMVLNGAYTDNSRSNPQANRNTELTPSTAYADVSSLLLSGSLQNAIADAFANVNNTGDGSPVNTERIDFVWQNGYVVQGTEVITIFNIDPVGNQDEFRIAAFTSLGSASITGLGTVNNIPTAYASTGIVITENLYNTTKLPLPIVANGGTAGSTTTKWNNVQFEDGSGDSFQVGQSGTDAIVDNQTTGAEAAGIGGITIKLTDLGLSVGQVFYGYSLMSTDVAPTTANSLVDWRNTSVFPTNTANNTGGTADFVTFGAQLFRPIPEPATFGLASFAGLAVFLGLRRGGRRRRGDGGTASAGNGFAQTTRSPRLC